MPRRNDSLPLTQSQARRIWLRAQRLDQATPFGAGSQAVADAVAHLGYVQIDTINVIERCHHHILFTRIPDYRREDLHQAQTKDKTVFEYVANGADVLKVGKFEMPSRAYLGRFNFKGTDQGKKVGNLSGGERGRLHLATTLIRGGNVLLLDEPSNDLDVETLRALEDALLEFAGCVMVISHDRWFLDRIATHIIAFEGDSHVEFFPGNYQEYEADKKKRLGEEGAKPKRIRYKPVVR